MKQMSNLIPGVARIYMIDASGLPPCVREMHSAGLPVAVIAELEEIPVKGKATLTSTTAEGVEGRTARTVLEFTAGDEISRLQRSAAFIVLGSDGIARLVGSRETPWPKIETSGTLSTATEGKRGTAVTVTWTGEPIPCTARVPSF